MYNISNRVKLSKKSQNLRDSFNINLIIKEFARKRKLVQVLLKFF